MEAKVKAKMENEEGEQIWRALRQREIVERGGVKSERRKERENGRELRQRKQRYREKWVEDEKRQYTNNVFTAFLNTQKNYELTQKHIGCL